MAGSYGLGCAVGSGAVLVGAVVGVGAALVGVGVGADVLVVVWVGTTLGIVIVGTVVRVVVVVGAGAEVVGVVGASGLGWPRPTHATTARARARTRVTNQGSHDPGRRRRRSVGGAGTPRADSGTGVGRTTASTAGMTAVRGVSEGAGVGGTPAAR